MMNIDNMNKSPILKLNRHCYYAIFDLLNLRDLYNFANTCQRIQDEFSSYLYWSKKVINCDNIKSDEVQDIATFLLKIKSPILKLNGYCFYAIFDFLNLRDQYNFSQTCQRIQSEFSSYLYWSKKSIKFDDIQCDDFQDILHFLMNIKFTAGSMQICGPYFNKKRNTILYKLAKHCQNLIKLKIVNFQQIGMWTLQKISKRMENLKELTLSRCELNDVHCLYLQNCRMLEKLDISENYVITGKYMNKFSKLKDLNLNYCKSIRPFYFIELCKSSKLKQLHVAFCEAFNEVTFRGMQKYLLEVDTLTISTNYRSKKIHFLVKLPMLRNLEIHGIVDIKPHFYDQLLEHKRCNLEKLTIIGSKRDNNISQALEPIFHLCNLKYLSMKYMSAMNDIWLNKIADMDSLVYFNCAGCQNIKQDGLISMILRLENLREVDISLCKQFNISLYQELITKLTAINNNRRLTLHVGQTSLMMLLRKSIDTPPSSRIVDLTPFISLPVEHDSHKLLRKK